jgi:hypothetical protein
MANPRRRSNSSSYSAGLKDFKTKFEQIETDPVFEEELHGPEEETDLEHIATIHTQRSESESSVAEEDQPKRA